MVLSSASIFLEGCIAAHLMTIVLVPHQALPLTGKSDRALDRLFYSLVAL